MAGKPSKTVPVPTTQVSAPAPVTPELLAQAEKKLAGCRVQLVMTHRWFGLLALQMLELKPNDQVPTMGTDGRIVYYNPTKVTQWTNAEVIGVLMHELLHCALGHVWRRALRDQWRWNVACDFAINPIVTESGGVLPAGCLLKQEWAGKSSEEIYLLLPDDLNEVGVGNQYTLSGDVLTPTSGTGNAAEQKQLQEAWTRAVHSATHVCQQQGTLPAGLKRLVDEAVRPRCDWKNLLARFLQQSVKTDYSWTYPAKRYMPHGLWLPRLKSEACPPIAVAIDTSGSIGERELSAFGAELNGILRQIRPEKVYLLWADAEVAGVQIIERDEPIVLEPKGGGGTDFRPVFDWVEANAPEACCLVYLTDLYGSFPAAEPEGRPTLWVSTTEQVAPFGDTIKLEDQV